MIKAILFDKDGTLINFKETWLPITQEVVRSMCQDYQVTELYDQLLEAVGVYGDEIDGKGLLACKTSADIAMKWYTMIGPDEASESFINKIRELLKVYVKERMNHIDFIPGVRQSLNLLKAKGYKLGIATADTREITEIMLEGLGAYEMFSFIGSEDGKLQAKPHPEMLERFCQAIDMDKEEVIIVGDTICDMQFGINAGVKTIGVLGSTEASVLKTYTEHVIQSVAELPEYLGLEAK